MKKEILKRLLAKPGEEHSVSEFDARYTGDLTKSEAEALLAENIGKLSSLQDKCMRRTVMLSSLFFRQWMLPERTGRSSM